MSEDVTDPSERSIPELSNLAPEPGADYWHTIDARLSAVEAGASPFPGSADTGDVVIRLDDMESRKPASPVVGRTLLVAAAAIATVIVAVGLLSLVSADDGATAIDTADTPTERPADTETPVEPDGTETPVEPDGTATPVEVEQESIPESETNPLDPACWVQDDGLNRFVLMMHLEESGVIRALTVVDTVEETAIGNYTGGLPGEAVMTVLDEFGRQTATEVWSLPLGEVHIREGVVAQSVSCDEVPETEFRLARLLSVDLPEIQPNLAAGSTHCWRPPSSSDAPLDDLYEITVAADGVGVDVIGYDFVDGNAQPVRLGSGRFVSDTGMAVRMTALGDDASTSPTEIFTVEQWSLTMTPFVTTILELTSCNPGEPVEDGAVRFSSPTENIVCGWQLVPSVSESASCFIRERTWEVLPEDVPENGECQFDFGNEVYIVPGEEPQFGCYSDVAWYLLSPDGTSFSTPEPLAYGKSIALGAIVCTSETTGLTCTDTTTGNSFVMARETYPLDSVG